MGTGASVETVGAKQPLEAFGTFFWVAASAGAGVILGFVCVGAAVTFYLLPASIVATLWSTGGILIILSILAARKRVEKNPTAAVGESVSFYPIMHPEALRA